MTLFKRQRSVCGCVCVRRWVSRTREGAMAMSPVRCEGDPVHRQPAEGGVRLRRVWLRTHVLITAEVFLGAPSLSEAVQLLQSLNTHTVFLHAGPAAAGPPLNILSGGRSGTPGMLLPRHPLFTLKPCVVVL